jgi:hypothetical protein
METSMARWTRVMGWRWLSCLVSCWSEERLSQKSNDSPATRGCESQAYMHFHPSEPCMPVWHLTRRVKWAWIRSCSPAFGEDLPAHPAESPAPGHPWPRKRATSSSSWRRKASLLDTDKVSASSASLRGLDRRRTTFFVRLASAATSPASSDASPSPSSSVSSSTGSAVSSISS